MLATFCGLLLWKAPFGEPWVNASYDYLFPFGAHSITNKVVLVLMDNAAFDQFHQPRGQPWDRGLHAQLLNKLADDGAELVVMDSFFRATNNPVNDKALADAMRRQRHIVLMAEQSQVTHPGMVCAQPALPTEPFFSAAGKNWGVAWLDPDPDLIVRRHWPFPSPGPYPSLAETAAKLEGASLNQSSQERWLRYYGQEGAWTKLSCNFALTQPKNYFRDKIVFIGTQPHTSVPNDDEQDKFRTPYTRWTDESSGGVEILVTSFLNLMNGDWLRRLASWPEFSVLLASGIFLGAGLCRMKWPAMCIFATVIAVSIALGAIASSYFSNFWFPWLIIAGGQVPCALAWATAIKIRRALKIVSTTGVIEKLPETQGYELFHPPFGEGAYGKVWLARNANGQWRALKVIYLENFDNNSNPYEREFAGVSRYKPVSDQHSCLLRVDFVSEKLDGYFYYVMELGDSLEPDWEGAPQKYKPRDLAGERARAKNRRLPVRDCIEIGMALTDALEFLHQRGLTHRDIKPQNVIFVNGQPKLADLGLISAIRSVEEIKTFVGTPGFMPPPPELPGTPQADIYALGILLYVISTGRNAAFFPEIATTLFDVQEPPDFLPLNAIILKACQPDLAKRYLSAKEMHCALMEICLDVPCKPHN